MNMEKITVNGKTVAVITGKDIFFVPSVEAAIEKLTEADPTTEKF